MALLSMFGAFFEGAKNAATPNLTGKEGLLAGTALMFSSSFLLMAVGSALGGLAAAFFGYKIAFIINAASFAGFGFFRLADSRRSDARKTRIAAERRTKRFDCADYGGGRIFTSGNVGSEPKRESFITELKEGLHYTIKNHFALTIFLMNIIWATGGGAINVIFERMGGVYFRRDATISTLI